MNTIWKRGRMTQSSTRCTSAACDTLVVKVVDAVTCSWKKEEERSHRGKAALRSVITPCVTSDNLLNLGTNTSVTSAWGWVWEARSGWFVDSHFYSLKTRLTVEPPSNIDTMNTLLSFLCRNGRKDSSGFIRYRQLWGFKSPGKLKLDWGTTAQLLGECVNQDCGGAVGSSLATAHRSVQNLYSAIQNWLRKHKNFENASKYP